MQVVGETDHSERLKKLIYLVPETAAAPARLEPQLCDPQPASIVRAMQDCGVQVLPRISRFSRIVGRGAKVTRTMRNMVQIRGRAYMLSTSWASDSQFFWRGLFFEIVPYVYDCWPSQYHQWLALFRRHRTRVAFVSSKGAASSFRKNLPHTNFFWMPEATDPGLYDPSRKLNDRRIDVLQYGRSYTKFDEAVWSSLDGSGRNYLCSRGRAIFPRYREVCAALADAKIVVCYPKSVTDPVSSGGLETVTLRYFETMASRALPIGCCPGELKDLFGYNPVIELKMERVGDQIEGVLTQIENYQELADRNLRRMHEVGSWNVRARSILKVLENYGYGI